MPDVEIEPTTPLSPEQLEEDARNSAVGSDEVTRDDGEPQLPASENERAETSGEGADKVEGDVALLPPD